jgi:hypothetical protein
MLRSSNPRSLPLQWDAQIVAQLVNQTSLCPVFQKLSCGGEAKTGNEKLKNIWKVSSGFQMFLEHPLSF